MRLKVEPEDFRVREVLEFTRDASGPFFVHRLQKEKIDTQEALGIVAQQASVKRSDIAFAGLKDRQGATEQWISIKGGRLDYRGRGIRVRFVGRSGQPVTSKMSQGNEFEIVVRDLGLDDVDAVQRCLPHFARSGFANYFDDQRFGCLRHGQGFVMKEILAGRFDRALRQLIAEPSRVAITGDVKLKQFLQRGWGDWERCARVARGPIYGRVFEHLVRRPADFRGALALLPTRLKLIHAFAYQSHLWNRAVGRLLRRSLPFERQIEIETRAGSCIAWSRLTANDAERLGRQNTPLYGPEGGGGSADFRRAMQGVLADAQLSPESFEVHKVPGMVLREEPRTLVVVPRQLDASAARRDERHPGRYKLRVTFGLPRGSYATMLIKHLFARAGRRMRPVGAGDGRRAGERRTREPRPGERRADARRAAARRAAERQDDAGTT